jgi:hypothetical protein
MKFTEVLTHEICDHDQVLYINLAIGDEDPENDREVDIEIDLSDLFDECVCPEGEHEFRASLRGRDGRAVGEVFCYGCGVSEDLA